MIQYKKILMTLALLLTAVTGAWADGIVCTASDLGKVLCTDGSIYENVSAATTAGKTAAAVIAYVDETNKNGLAIALADEASSNWSTAKSTCEGKTPTVTGAKWCLPSLDQWKQMFKANGGSDANWSGLNTTITTAEGTTLQSNGNYWSSTNNNAPYRVALVGNGSANFDLAFDYSEFQVRACLAFAITDPNAVEVKWDAATKTGTFTMPAFNVELTPVYAPVAVLATDGEPTPIEGIIAGEAKDIVKAGIVAKAGSTENAQGTLMYLVTTTKEQPTSTTGFSATVPTGAALTGSFAEDQTVYVWYYIKGADTPQGQTATAENTFNDSEICATPLTVKLKANQFDIQFNAANANTIEAGKATVTVGGTAATVTEGKLEGVKMGSEVMVTAKEGYKFRKVEVKKGGGEPVLLTTITAADNSSFKSGSQTFGDVATVTLTGDYLINDGNHGGWYCQGSNKTATISVAEANGANITSVKFYTAGGGSAEDKDAPFEVTTTTVTSSNITTYLNGNSIGSYGVSKIEVYGTK